MLIFDALQSHILDVFKLPVFRAKKEVFNWLKTGEKTIDIRKSKGQRGEIATYLSGRKVLRMKINKREIGRLDQVVREDNYKQVIPSASRMEEALEYLRQIYGSCDGDFTAYYVTTP